MVDFGQFGDHNVRVALTQCRQGTAAALIAIKNAAEILHPKVALFVGICGTMKPTKAKLGDVVISAKLATYEVKEIRPDGTVEYGGSKPDVSRNMARLISSAADGWNPPLEDPRSRDIKVHHDAVMLSGSELVNYGPRREELADYFRDALGLETEGAGMRSITTVTNRVLSWADIYAVINPIYITEHVCKSVKFGISFILGLYAAAHDSGLEWAVIKAVSDFADGSNTATEDWQPFASVMAASLVHHMFKYPDVVNQWPHYQITNLAPSIATGIVHHF